MIQNGFAIDDTDADGRNRVQQDGIWPRQLMRNGGKDDETASDAGSASFQPR